MRIEIIHTPPQLVSRPQRGWWRITAHYADGKIISKDYYASNQGEAKYTFLIEHGRVRGTVDAVFLGEGRRQYVVENCIVHRRHGGGSLGKM